MHTAKRSRKTCKELAAAHSITSSARARRAGADRVDLEVDRYHWDGVSRRLPPDGPLAQQQVSSSEVLILISLTGIVATVAC
jgi:hypothetical protein